MSSYHSLDVTSLADFIQAGPTSAGARGRFVRASAESWSQPESQRRLLACPSMSALFAAKSPSPAFRTGLADAGRNNPSSARASFGSITRSVVVLVAAEVDAKFPSHLKPLPSSPLKT